MINGKKNRSAKTKNYIINVNCYTWINNSHGLFDYESENFYKKCFKIKCLYNFYYILKDDINVEIKNEEEISKIMLNNTNLKLICKIKYINNNYQLIPCIENIYDDTNNSDTKINESNDNNMTDNHIDNFWVIVKYLKNKSSVLHEDDVIKLGRVKLKIKKIITNIQQEKEYNKSISPFDDDECETVAPETEHFTGSNIIEKNMIINNYMNSVNGHVNFDSNLSGDICIHCGTINKSNNTDDIGYKNNNSNNEDSYVKNYSSNNLSSGITNNNNNTLNNSYIDGAYSFKNNLSNDIYQKCSDIDNKLHLNNYSNNTNIYNSYTNETNNNMNDFEDSKYKNSMDKNCKIIKENEIGDLYRNLMNSNDSCENLIPFRFNINEKEINSVNDYGDFDNNNNNNNIKLNSNENGEYNINSKNNNNNHNADNINSNNSNNNNHSNNHNTDTINSSNSIMKNKCDMNKTENGENNDIIKKKDEIIVLSNNDSNISDDFIISCTLKDNNIHNNKMKSPYLKESNCTTHSCCHKNILNINNSDMQMKEISLNSKNIRNIGDYDDKKDENKNVYETKQVENNDLDYLKNSPIHISYVNITDNNNAVNSNFGNNNESNSKEPIVRNINYKELNNRCCNHYYERMDLNDKKNRYDNDENRKLGNDFFNNINLLRRNNINKKNNNNNINSNNSSLKGTKKGNNYENVDFTNKEKGEMINSAKEYYIQYKKGFSISSLYNCRICLCEYDDVNNPLISPCKCKGSMKYVHLNCLRTWMRGRLNVRNDCSSYSFFWKQLNCELCKFPYPTYIYVQNKYLELYEIPKPELPYIIIELINDRNKGFYIVSLANTKYVRMGRGHDSDVRVNDISVSRFHAMIKFHNGNFYIEDCKSKFGTLIQIRKPVFFNIRRNKFIALQIGRTVMYVYMKRKNWIFLPLCLKLSKTKDEDVSTLDNFSSKLLIDNNMQLTNNNFEYNRINNELSNYENINQTIECVNNHVLNNSRNDNITSVHNINNQNENNDLNVNTNNTYSSSSNSNSNNGNINHINNYNNNVSSNNNGDVNNNNNVINNNNNNNSYSNCNNISNNSNTNNMNNYNNNVSSNNNGDVNNNNNVIINNNNSYNNCNNISNDNNNINDNNSYNNINSNNNNSNDSHCYNNCNSDNTNINTTTTNNNNNIKNNNVNSKICNHSNDKNEDIHGNSDDINISINSNNDDENITLNNISASHDNNMKILKNSNSYGRNNKNNTNNCDNINNNDLEN